MSQLYICPKHGIYSKWCVECRQDQGIYGESFAELLNLIEQMELNEAELRNKEEDN